MRVSGDVRVERGVDRDGVGTILVVAGQSACVGETRAVGHDLDQERMRVAATRRGAETAGGVREGAADGRVGLAGDERFTGCRVDRNAVADLDAAGAADEAQVVDAAPGFYLADEGIAAEKRAARRVVDRRADDYREVAGGADCGELARRGPRRLRPWRRARSHGRCRRCYRR